MAHPCRVSSTKNKWNTSGSAPGRRYAVRLKSGRLKAFQNACLHRGRQLIDANGISPISGFPASI